MLEVRAKQDPNVIPVMCCDTVNRVAYGDANFLHQADTTLVALDAKTGRWRGRQEWRSGQSGRAPRAARRQGQVLIGISGGEFGVQCTSRLRPQERQAVWRLLRRADDQILFDPDKTTRGKPVARTRAPRLARRPVEDRWRLHMGLASYDPV